jgi:hypothetical protein
MNRRMLARAGSLALIVLSTSSTATDCERMNAENSGSSSSRSGYQVDVRAADDVCWKITMDGDHHEDCGDATYYGHRSVHDARVERTDGKGTVRVTMRSGGRVRDRATIGSSGDHAHLTDDGDARDTHDSSSWRSSHNGDDGDNDSDDN